MRIKEKIRNTIRATVLTNMLYFGGLVFFDFLAQVGSPYIPSSQIEEKISEERTLPNPVAQEDLAKEYGLIEGSGQEKIKNALTKIANESNNPLYKILAENLLKSEITEINVQLLSGKQKRGSYNYETKTLSVNPNVDSSIDFERAILHEYIHHLTGHIIRLPKNKRTANDC